MRFDVSVVWVIQNTVYCWVVMFAWAKKGFVAAADPPSSSFLFHETIESTRMPQMVCQLVCAGLRFLRLSCPTLSYAAGNSQKCTGCPKSN